MIVYICESCGAEHKADKPEVCLLCKRSHDFYEDERNEPSAEDKAYSKLFEDAVHELETYDEGVDLEEFEGRYEE
ncbi:MAG: hypothetical protein H6502_03290 [Candidatus Woesearchaeota archaeon]|nr:MAG: hypothetical protein H6502_03290 [Candidatus Woesearchaeota archaeon]